MPPWDQAPACRDSKSPQSAWKRHNPWYPSLCHLCPAFPLSQACGIYSPHCTLSYPLFKTDHCPWVITEFFCDSTIANLCAFLSVWWGDRTEEIHPSIMEQNSHPNFRQFPRPNEKPEENADSLCWWQKPWQPLLNLTWHASQPWIGQLDAGWYGQQWCPVLSPCCPQCLYLFYLLYIENFYQSAPREHDSLFVFSSYLSMTGINVNTSLFSHIGRLHFSCLLLSSLFRIT